MPDSHWQVISLAYTSRLAHEKWFDLVLDLCEEISSQDKPPFHIHILWDWPLKWDLLKKIGGRDFVTYYGRVSKNKLKRIVSTCDYWLLPSRFLETFWLSALDFISLWKPCFAFKKWWVSQFGWCILPLQESIPLFNQIPHTLKNIWQHKKTLSNLCKETTLLYTTEQRITRSQDILWIPSKILFLSDYAKNIWWIEQYVENTRSLLENKWYSTTFYWYSWELPRWLLSVFSSFNVSALLWLQKQLKKKPDIIRIHSYIRWFWWLPFFFLPKSSSKFFVMHHDFWLVHPFPSLVYNEKQLSIDWIVDYVKASFQVLGLVKWFFSLPFVVGKYILSLLLVASFKKHNCVHLFPSDFMPPYYEKFFLEKNMKVLPHALW